jgi:pilus assembly protein CpaF
MFGKRSNSATGSRPAAAIPEVVTIVTETPRANKEPALPMKAPSEQRPESYFQTKSMIFGALIEAIDLAALSKLDQESAREEIRDIVHEIVTIKNLVLSRATTSPTSWSMVPRARSSRSRARSSSRTSASATPRN